MQPIQKTILIVAFIATFLLGGLSGYMIAKPRQPQQVITTQTILTSLQDQGFLVSKSYVFATPVTITETEGSVWKDLLFGQVIEAHGTMEVNVGTDLKAVTEAQVVVTDSTITVTIPASKLFNTRLIGPIELKNKQGLLKRIFDNDNGYNQALDALRVAAEKAATDQALMQDATQSSVKEVTRLVGLMAPGRTVTINVQQ